MSQDIPSFFHYAMNKKILSAALMIGILTVPAQAQENNLVEKFAKFRKKAHSDYENYRKELNGRYAEFMKKAWNSFKAEEPVARPKEEEVPPIVIEPEDTLTTVPQLPPVQQPIKKVVEPPVVPAPPQPVAPIKEITPTVEAEKKIETERWGTKFNVRFNDNQRFSLADCSNDALSKAWKQISESKQNNTIRDCLLLRAERQLNDWSYLCLLQSIAKEIYGESNEAVLYTAYLFCQSGYKIRLGRDNAKLHLLFATQHIIYERPFFIIDAETFYSFTGECKQMDICDVPFPEEKPLSLLVAQQPRLEVTPTDSRTIKSKRYSAMEFSVNINKNILQLYEEYPSSSIEHDFMTRWAMYANTPVSKEIKEKLYPQLDSLLADKGEVKAVEMLLNWVQTGFEYEFDDNVWGADRAFFAEETLYYPYCDCEDRSILFSHLVRDILNLNVVLVYYPGHLATAVEFNEEVSGDYITVNNKKFVICDPTYINASVGMSMPNLDTSNISAILLNK